MVVNVPVNNGLGAAEHDKMVRVDVFRAENEGYYLIPIYVADTLKPKLPQKACVAKKGYDQWKLMLEEDFVFSLYPNDLIKITSKSLLKFKIKQNNSTLPDVMESYTALVYYNGTDRANAAIEAVSHDGAYEISTGVKTLERIEKYTVDVLGEYHRVEREKRQGFHGKRG